MIAEIAVENLAIIDRADLTLGPGFTVLSGETGAGKSLLIDAIELALGERADADLVRAGARSARVTVRFDLRAALEADSRCTEQGFPTEGGDLHISREVLLEGRSQSRIQGRPGPNSVLRTLGQALVDLHGQHDHQSLLYQDRHLSFLDKWIGEPAQSILLLIESSYGRLLDARQRIDLLRRGVRDREHRLDLLRYQLGEIETVDPRPGEYEETEQQLLRLQHLDRLTQATQEARTKLGEGETSAMDLLGASLKRLQEAQRLDPSLAPGVEAISMAFDNLTEGLRELDRYADSLDPDPLRLEQLAERLDSLRRLRKKYGDDETAVIEFAARAREELLLLENDVQSEEELETELTEADRQVRGQSAELSELRKSRARAFADLVAAELHQLALERAQFEVVFRPQEPTFSGMDDVEFFFSANAGEPPRPLTKIASGGEVSRLMLALKTVLAGKAGVPTLVFDEVDSGLGGRAAATLGRKLQELSRAYQVIVITHLPQVAARADVHFKIEKIEDGGRVVTRVRRLEQKERVEEIARMLAGETLTQAAMQNARELLAESQPAGLFE